METCASGGAQFRIASDQALIVYFDAPAEKKGAKHPPLQGKTGSHEQVRRLLRLMELEPIPGLQNLHPAYSSLLIKFDALKVQHVELEAILRGYIGRMKKVELPEPQVVEIPVCYGGEYGPDLKNVAELHGMSEAAAIELHCSRMYLVYFLGFAPGFAYLGDVPEELATPRLATPRRSVPEGSVGIAGRQTGVYPISTPGGWRLLGRTPVAMFCPEKAEMSPLRIGDRVRFVPISPEKFAKLKQENA